MIHFYSADTSKLKWYSKPFNLSYLIKLFTHWQYPSIPFDKTWTHVSIGEDEGRTRKIIFESNLAQMLSYYDNPLLTAHFVSSNIQLNDLTIFLRIVDTEHSKPYARLQLIDFVRVWFMNKLFKRDPKNVWFPKSSVCSEIAYTCAMLYADKYGLKYLSQRLRDYNSNLYSPMRLYGVLKEAEEKGEVIFE